MYLDMKNFKLLVYIFVFAVLLGCNGSSEPSGSQLVKDTPEERLNWAQEYMRVMPMSDLLDDMTNKMSANMKSDVAEKFKSLMKKSIDVQLLEKTARDSMVKHFTASELRALAQFYGSNEGKSVMKKFGEYMADVMPIMQAQVMQAAQKAANNPQPNN